MVLKMEFEKEFEQKFREAAMRKFGFSKSVLMKLQGSYPTLLCSTAKHLMKGF